MTVDARELVPDRPSLRNLKAAAADCKACELWKRGTQTVFGEGRTGSQILFVGEQPGDYEDREGKPFVGPAGKLLDRALEEAGIDRTLAYVTNAVKHFKWQPKGKRRIHQKPNWSELAACRPWLDAEVGVVKPQVIVALGATAAQSLLGRSFRITRERGRPIPGDDLAPWIMATVHPSSILRAPDEEARREAYGEFVADLTTVRELLEAPPPS